MENLINTLKEQIIDVLNLEEITAEEIDAAAPIFGDNGLGLDSIDALELIVLLEKNYGIRFSDPSEAKQVFVSIATMAEYISKNRTK
ncbi:MAG: acyl carrier protein [Muribaculaceae bacterium]|nr:acyl carrier protein [Muribaculaceae bacterium]